ncbi:hypothetical protein AZ78_4658 [Lysobacter capsici AZ78]|uniref:Uncharacterized protein n=1 Tax=Lysobacter capsici AZ78 TaxID=1444315 RepID=A0A120AI30_9GAMM|nr:hypothetical protein AZ78_4658 [Lysobacter capsici AZ78]
MNAIAGQYFHRKLQVVRDRRETLRAGTTGRWIASDSGSAP